MEIHKQLWIFLVSVQQRVRDRCQMKRAVQQCAPLSRLFTAEETRGLVTEADVRANREFDRAAGPSGILDFLGGCAVFSPTDSMSSWVVWALNEVGEGGTGLDGADGRR